MAPENIKSQLQQAFPEAHIAIQGDDGVHFDALVVTDAFSGKSPVARHRMIYKALGDAMRADIHALSITAQTQNEYQHSGD